MGRRYYIEVTCSDCGAKYQKRKDLLKVWSGKCMSCSRITTGMGSHYITVICKDCGVEYKKRADSTKVWNGRCRSCTSKEVASRPGAKERMSKAAKKLVAELGGIDNRGQKHWNWKGGISSERKSAMAKMKYKNWRTSVFQRDDYTCQICGSRGGELQADHIKPWATYKDKRYDLSNGRTLCKPCHLKTPTWGIKGMLAQMHD